MKLKSLRALKMGSVLYKAMCEHFMTDHREVIGMCTVSRVEVSSNFRNCNVFIVPGDKNINCDHILNELNSISSSISYSLAKSVNLRLMPNLHFKLDSEYFEFIRVNEIISKVIEN